MKEASGQIDGLYLGVPCGWSCQKKTRLNYAWLVKESVKIFGFTEEEELEDIEGLLQKKQKKREQRLGGKGREQREAWHEGEGSIHGRFHDHWPAMTRHPSHE